MEHTAPHRWSAGGGDPIEQPAAGELQHGTAQEGVGRESVGARLAAIHHQDPHPGTGQDQCGGGTPRAGSRPRRRRTAGWETCSSGAPGCDGVVETAVAEAPVRREAGLSCTDDQGLHAMGHVSRSACRASPGSSGLLVVGAR